MDLLPLFLHKIIEVGLHVAMVVYPISKVVFFRQLNFYIFYHLRVDNEKELSKIQRIMLI